MTIQLLEGNKAKPRKQQAQPRYHEKRREPGSDHPTSTDFCTRNATSLGPVYTHPDIFEKGTFSSVSVLPSTRKWRLQAAKTQVFKTDSRAEIFENAGFSRFTWRRTDETEKRMMSYINTLHVSSAREAVVFYHQVKIIQIRLKPRRKKKSPFWKISGNVWAGP